MFSSRPTNGASSNTSSEWSGAIRRPSPSTSAALMQAMNSRTTLTSSILTSSIGSSLDLTLQPVEAFFPHRGEGLQPPVVDVSEGMRIDLVLPLPAVLLGPHEVGFAQHPQVLRHCGPADVREAARDLPRVRAGLVAEQLQDRPSRRVREGRVRRVADVSSRHELAALPSACWSSRLRSRGASPRPGRPGARTRGGTARRACRCPTA